MYEIVNACVDRIKFLHNPDVVLFQILMNVKKT